MKITIEVEIQPEEVGLATELLSTLRTLTDHVRVVTPGAGVLAASAGPPAAVLPKGPKAPFPAPDSSLSNGTADYHTALQSAPDSSLSNGTADYHTALQSAPQRPQLPQSAAPATPQVSDEAVAQLAGASSQSTSTVVPPSVQRHPQAFALIVPRLGDPATQEQATADVIATLRAAGEDVEKAVEELVAAYEQLVFDNPEVVGSMTGVMPYMSLYQRTPDDLKKAVKGKMMTKVLTVLAKKRPVVVADRAAFFAYADAFACMVKFGAVTVEAAVQTLNRLLIQPHTRSAAVTMLGKMVEYCGEQILRIPKDSLAGLWHALDMVKEEAFSYDLKYILGTLRMMMPPGSQLPLAAAAPGALGQAAAAPAGAGASAGAAAPPARPTAITHLGCYQGHSATVFTLCYDAAHGQLSSGGQDGQLLVWGHDGTPTSRMDVSSHFVCSLDFLPRSGTLLAATVPNPDASHTVAEASCVLAFTPPGGAATPGQPRVGAWSPRGRLYGMNRGMISFVRALGGDGDAFVTGESATQEQSQGPREVVCLYDASRGGPMEQLKPLMVYSEHQEMVTCAAPWSANPHVFVSGGRDATVRVWDRRMPQSVGSFGEVVDPASGRVQAHSDMITCLDTTDNLLLSAALDGFMCIWDFRQLNMTHGSVAGPVVKLQIDTQPALKMAVTGAPHSRLVAISTYQGLYVMDFTNMTAPTTVAVPQFADGRPFKYYHDIRWAGGPGTPGQPVLFGASDDPRIDIFRVAF